MAKKKAAARVPGTKSKPAPVFPLPDVRGMEAMLAAIGRGSAHYPADEALLQAQDLMYEAFDARGARRAALAREALAISPDCADAYLLLAEETASSVEEARELLEQGVAAGERALGPKSFEDDLYQARRYGLKSGLYHWYVWPGFGSRSQAHYGQLLGQGTFAVR